MRPILKLAILAVAALVALPASAATTTPVNFNVTAAVVKGCTVVAPSINFGNYDPSIVGTDTPAAAVNIQVKCTKGVIASVNKLTTANTFAMKSTTTGDLLSYKLYQDAGRTADWSAVAAPNQTAASSQTALNFPVYGFITANQNVGVAADYTDAVTVVVTFN